MIQHMTDKEKIQQSQFSGHDNFDPIGFQPGNKTFPGHTSKVEEIQGSFFQENTLKKSATSTEKIEARIPPEVIGKSKYSCNKQLSNRQDYGSSPRWDLLKNGERSGMESLTSYV